MKSSEEFNDVGLMSDASCGVYSVYVAVRCAAKCGAVRSGAVRRGAVRCREVRCSRGLRCGAERCGVVRCGAGGVYYAMQCVLCGAVRRCGAAVRCREVRCDAACKDGIRPSLPKPVSDVVCYFADMHAVL